MSIHGNIDTSLLVIPFQVQAAAVAACPFLCDGAVLFEGGEEMVGVLFVCALDSEIIDSQTKDDGV